MSNLQVGIVMGHASEATVKLLVTAIRDMLCSRSDEIAMPWG